MRDKDLIHDNLTTGNCPDSFALIIGAMKSGTTSLYEILSQHPQICASRVKEPDYFVEYTKDLVKDDYLGLWDWEKGVHQVALESSVAYAKAPLIAGVPERIAKSRLGQFRFIYVLRHPLDRIESQARHGLFAGWGKSLDLGVSEDLVSFSSYAMQLDCYLEYFSKEEIIVVTLEEFKLKPEAVLSRVCAFLGVDSDFQFTDVRKERNSGEFFESSPIIARVTQGKVGQYIAQRVLPKKIKQNMRGWIAKYGKIKKQNSNDNVGRWRLKPEERALVIELLSDDLHRLGSEYGVDIQKYWNIEFEHISA